MGFGERDGRRVLDIYVNSGRGQEELRDGRIEVTKLASL